MRLDFFAGNRFLWLSWTARASPRHRLGKARGSGERHGEQELEAGAKRLRLWLPRRCCASRWPAALALLLGFRLATGPTADGWRCRAARLPPRHRTHGGRLVLPRCSASASPPNRTAAAPPAAVLAGAQLFCLIAGAAVLPCCGAAARLTPRHRTAPRLRLWRRWRCRSALLRRGGRLLQRFIALPERRCLRGAFCALSRHVAQEAGPCGFL